MIDTAHAVLAEGNEFPRLRARIRLQEQRRCLFQQVLLTVGQERQRPFDAAFHSVEDSPLAAPPLIIVVKGNPDLAGPILMLGPGFCRA